MMVRARDSIVFTLEVFVVYYWLIFVLYLIPTASADNLDVLVTRQ